MISRVYRKFKKLSLRLKIKLHERKIQVKNNEYLKYLFFKGNSKSLIVVFSGMSKDRAKYNYINILTKYRSDKVYFLDDFGEEKLGAYYLCVNKDYYVENGIDRVLDDVIRKNSYKQVFFVGSSKGGWASLYYGLNYPGATIIIGAPQYYLGDYLLTRKSPQLLYTILGQDYTESDILFLNNLIKKKIICSSNSSQRIYIHYSDQEHTFNEHIKFLLQDLHDNSCSVTHDVCHYNDHNKVAKYYPDFLIRVLTELLD